MLEYIASISELMLGNEPLGNSASYGEEVGRLVSESFGKHYSLSPEGVIFHSKMGILAPQPVGRIIPDEEGRPSKIRAVRSCMVKALDYAKEMSRLNGNNVDAVEATRKEIESEYF